MSDFSEKLITLLGEENLCTDEPLSAHTSFQVGGPADYWVSPENAEQLAGVMALCREESTPWYVFGRGSNVLVSDEGFRGVAISLKKGFSSCRAEGNLVYAGAGAGLGAVAAAALQHGLSGFEFAAGIPGSMGGAMVMNAGAYGGELKDVLTGATVLTPEGELLCLTGEEMELGYRTSCIQKKGYIGLEARISLEPGNPEEIRARMDELADRRKSKQPLEFPSAGSTFKRPSGYFAGKLIEEAGLRGFRVGGAQVSEKHCGFVINRDHATASEILELCRQVQNRVKEHSGVELELEVRLLGFGQ